MTPDYRAMCAELADALVEWQLGGGPPEDTADADLIDRARALLAEPPAVGPSELELEAIELALWDKYRTKGWGGAEFMYDTSFSDALKEYRAALDRWGHQPARLRSCPTHGQQPPEAWGCPDCVRELREELAASRHPTPAAAPVPEPGEVEELVEWLGNPMLVSYSLAASDSASRRLIRVADLLAQRHPAPPAEGEVE